MPMSIFVLGKISEVPEIVTLDEPVRAIGLKVRTGIESVFKDVAEVVKKYKEYKEKNGIPNQREPWQYVSLSSNFKDDQTWDYHTGHAVTSTDDVPEGFAAFEIPPGKYAVFPVRPKHKLLLGLTVARTKRHIYNTWMPNSGYEFAGYEFEYNDEKMHKESKHFIDLYIALREKSR
ncbi:MAG: GyrI-like domain-containing protein [Desulfobacteraceae bacterium]|nr:GyrI-like domain-containing protein [Desulfobacteraceae bacterium]